MTVRCLRAFENAARQLLETISVRLEWNSLDSSSFRTANTERMGRIEKIPIRILSSHKCQTTHIRMFHHQKRINSPCTTLQSQTQTLLPSRSSAYARVIAIRQKIFTIKRQLFNCKWLKWKYFKFFFEIHSVREYKCNIAAYSIMLVYTDGVSLINEVYYPFHRLLNLIKQFVIST